MSCDQYRSAFCNCVNQLLRPIADDLNGTLQTNVFSDIGRNVAGNTTNLLNGVDACHYMHHGTFIAQQTGDTWLRRTHLLFILSTIVTGNAFYHFVVLPFCEARLFWGFGKLIRILSILIWPAVGATTALVQESGTQNIILWLLVPPLLLLLWYEFLLPPLKMDPFIHPYTFAVLQAIFVLISLVESHVLDYNILWTEIWKSHLISCLYFGVCWFHLFLDNDDQSRSPTTGSRHRRRSICPSFSGSLSRSTRSWLPTRTLLAQRFCGSYLESLCSERSPVYLDVPE